MFSRLSNFQKAVLSKIQRILDCTSSTSSRVNVKFSSYCRGNVTSYRFHSAHVPSVIQDGRVKGAWISISTPPRSPVVGEKVFY